MSECIFCKIIAKEIPATIVAETDNYLAFNDINGQAPKHILCIPKNHHSGISEMEDQLELGGLLMFANSISKDDSFSNGFRYVINNGEDGGQTVYHTHLHILAGRKLQWPPG